MIDGCMSVGQMSITIEEGIFCQVYSNSELDDNLFFQEESIVVDA